MFELDTINKHSSDSHLKMPRVIVIDDDKDSVETLSALLQQKGIDVVGMGFNGKDALDLYVQEKPDFVILDMKMPEYDGPYAINKIKEIDPKAKIIAVTAYTDYQFKTGDVLASLKKPYEISELLKVIKGALN